MHPQELSHQNLYPTDAEQPGSSPHKGHMVRPNVTAKGRSRVKRRDASGSSDPFVDEIDQADGWMQITEVFCTHLALSDYSTKQGVKKILRSYERIYERLERLYELHSTNYKVTGGVVAIYAKLCAKTCLRNELFKDGFIASYIPLLNSPPCRSLAFRALMAIAHHGGAPARSEIARHVPSFLKSIEYHPDDWQTTEYALVTIAHALEAVAGDNLHVPNAKIWRNLDLARVLNAFNKALHEPLVSHNLVTHAINFFAAITLHFHRQCKAHISTMTFLVAVLRSRNIAVRCTALDAIFNLFITNVELPRSLNTATMMTALRRGYPPHLYQCLSSYGRERTDSIITVRVAMDFQRAFTSYTQGHNLYTLGAALATIILSTENISFQGTFQLQVEGKGLVVTTCIEALPHCATAIRAKGGDTGQLDISDILFLKYLLLQGTRVQTIAYAKKAILRNPANAYFYYALSMSESSFQALSAAKKGLRSKQITPFVGYALLHRAASIAAILGTTSLLRHGAAGSHTQWAPHQTVGLAYLSSAVRDSMRYLQGAPPDQVNMQQMLHWHILLSVTVYGPSLHQDMREVQPALSRLPTAYEFGNFWGMGAPKTTERLVQEMLTSLYPAAVTEWAAVVERFDNLANGKHPISTTKAEDDLGAWLDNAEDGNPSSRSAKCAHPKPDLNNMENYWCSWCSCPGSQLRLCDSCNKVRYCDLGCLQAHAPEHRAVCGSTPLPPPPAKPLPVQPTSTGRTWVDYQPAIAQGPSGLPVAPGYICEEID